MPSTGATARYAIAERLTEEAKRAALAVSYRPTVSGTGRVLPRYQDDGGLQWCPLGVAFRALGDFPWRTPSAVDVADALVSPLVSPARGTPWDELRAEAADFIVDWDHGRIADLAAALGMTGGDARS